MNSIERHDPVEGVLRLSAHEMATLMLLRAAPIDANQATPDVRALRKAGLAKLVESDIGNLQFVISANGNAVLRALEAG
nr:hypothetical protein [Trinickia mobilis]